MKVEKNISLKKYNTFQVEYLVDTLLTLEKEDDFSHKFLKKYFEEKFLILGEGSNILFTKDFKGTALFRFVQEKIGMILFNGVLKKNFLQYIT